MNKVTSQGEQRQIVLIETSGTIKTLKTKEVSTETLYKKCGFRVSDDFLCRHTWQVKLADTTYNIAVWAKKTGKANFENKYDFPPPVDNELFFGTCALVRVDGEGKILDLTKETWLKIYEQLFGGFEDIGEEDEFSEDELANVDPSLLTAHGYLKDGFVVSDTLESGDVSSEDIPDEHVAEENSSKTAPKNVSEKSTKKIKTVKQKKGKAKKEEEEIDDSASELEAEVYTFSDDD